MAQQIQLGKRLTQIGFLLFFIDYVVSTALVPLNLEETNFVLFGFMASVGLLISPALIVVGVVLYLYSRNKTRSKSLKKHEWTSYEKTTVVLAVISIIIGIIGVLLKVF